MTEKAYRQASAFSNEEVLILPVANQPLRTRALTRLFKSCADNTARASRDAAILALLYGCGLRRQELVALDFKDFDNKHVSIQVLYGRGAQARLVYPPKGAQAALEGWLRHRGAKAGPLFKRIRRGDHIQDSRMTDQSVLLVVKNRGEKAGLAALTAHELRQSFISNLLDQGASLSAVQHLAGHRHAQSTLRYDRTAERAKEDAARKLMVPYKKPRTSAGT
jgi:site-specific recombinase XerD